MTKNSALICLVDSKKDDLLRDVLTPSFGEKFSSMFFRRCLSSLESILLETETKLNCLDCFISHDKEAEDIGQAFKNIANVVADNGAAIERMRKIYSTLKSDYQNILFVTPRTPQINFQHIQFAIERANNNNAVLGKARDGEFYLCLLPSDLSDHFWDGLTGRSCSKIAQQLEIQDKNIVWLPEIAGISQEQDLMLVQEDLINNVITTEAQNSLADLIRQRSSLY